MLVAGPCAYLSPVAASAALLISGSRSAGSLMLRVTSSLFAWRRMVSWVIS
ncbi:hypothetical protein ABDJ25_19095 [Streptomyces actinocidus]